MQTTNHRMKLVFIFSALLMGGSFCATGQEVSPDSTSVKTGEVKATGGVSYVTRDELDSVFTIMLDSAIKAEKSVSLGKIFLVNKKGMVPVYKSVGTKKDRTDSLISASREIDRVEIYIKGFAIQTISIFMKDGKDKFSNSVPIPLTYFDKRITDRLGSRNSNAWVKLGDVIDYVPNRENTHAQNELFLPPLNTKNPAQELLVDGKLNSLINVRVFSDFAALLRNEPNGAIQFEADATYPLKLKNKSNTPVYLLHYLQPRVTVSRFNEEFVSLKADSIMVEQIDGMDTTEVVQNTVDIMRAYQQSWLRAGINLNLFHYTPLTNHIEFMVDMTAQFNQGTVTRLDEEEEIMTMFDFGLRGSLLSRPMKHFGLLTSIEVDYMHFSRLDEFELEKKTVLRLNTTMEAFYENDKDNRIFLRWAYFDDVSNQLRDFSQFQFGYSTNLKVDK